MQRISNPELVYPDLSYTLYGLLFQTHNELGRYRPEKQYADFFENLLKEKGLNYRREGRDKIGDQPDFTVEDKVVVEIKAKRALTKDDYFQTKRYLQSHKKRLALLVNFRNQRLRPKRILNNIYS